MKKILSVTLTLLLLSFSAACSDIGSETTTENSQSAAAIESTSEDKNVIADSSENNTESANATESESEKPANAQEDNDETTTQ